MGNKIKELEDGFSSIIGKYDTLHHTGLKGILMMKRLKDSLLAIKPIKGESILEVGSGSGRYTVELLKRETRVTCLDIVQGMLDDTREKIEHAGYSATFYRGNVLDLPFRDATFDKVLALGVIPHLPNKKLLDKAVSEMLRVVKPKGSIFFDVPRYHILKILYTKLYRNLKPFTRETGRLQNNLFKLKEITTQIVPNTKISVNKTGFGIYYLVKIDKP